MTNDKGITKPEKRSGRVEDSFWNDQADSVVREQPEADRVYDLEERTATFGEAIIDFAKTIPQSPITSRLISQLVGAGASVSANYCEADDDVSEKDFLKSIGTCRKEARETKHFLRMIARAVPELKLQARELWMEAKGVAFDFLTNLERPKEMSKTPCEETNARRLVRHSSFAIPSSFVTRASSF